MKYVTPAMVPDSCSRRKKRGLPGNQMDRSRPAVIQPNSAGVELQSETRTFGGSDAVHGSPAGPGGARFNADLQGRQLGSRDPVAEDAEGYESHVRTARQVKLPRVGASKCSSFLDSVPEETSSHLRCRAPSGASQPLN